MQPAGDVYAADLTALGAGSESRPCVRRRPARRTASTARLESAPTSTIDEQTPPIDRNEKIENADAAEPIDPMDANEPIEPIEIDDPMDAIEACDPIDARERVERSDPRRRRRSMLTRYASAPRTSRLGA